MLKPLIFVRGLNILPILSHSRNINAVMWKEYIEYNIPIYNEILKGEPELIYDKDKIIIRFREYGFRSDTNK